MGVIQRIKKPVSHKGKRILLKKEPQVIEDKKQVLFINGRKTSDLLRSCVRDLYSLKRPDAIIFGKKNDILPFENVAPVENFCRKLTASLFLFASSNKKRPNNIVLGRTFDHKLLDMIELGVKNYKPFKEFGGEKIADGLKPCLIFSGEDFDTKPELSRLKNLLIDFFHREPVKKIRLQGLQHVIMFTAANDIVYFRSYRTSLKATGHELPRVELEEIGPSIDFVLRRNKLASDDLFKTACKKPKELKIKKKKNLSTHPLGTKEAKIHISKQNISKVRTKPIKGIRRGQREKKTKPKEKA